MHETRNFVLVLLLAIALGWGGVSWFIFDDDVALVTAQRWGALVAVIAFAGWIFYAFKIEDKLPDRLADVVGSVYYDADGLAFMPTVRAHDGFAELCVYYQNRFEGPVQVIVHLRPAEDSFIIQPGSRDVHIAFTALGGDFGVIHQPIAVPDHLQGEVIDVELAAASYYPRSHGTRLRKRGGMPCGAMLVDWGGSAFKTGVYEVSGEIPLQSPARIHLSMPKEVAAYTTGSESWRQERFD